MQLHMGMSVGALAEELPSTTIKPDSEFQTGETELTYTADKSYTITIPSKVDLSSGEATEEIKAENVLINDGDTLKIAVTSDNSWNLILDSKNKIKYTAMVSENDLSQNSGAVLSIKNDGTKAIETQTATINFSLTGTAFSAGTYTDQLTFTVSCDAAE